METINIKLEDIIPYKNNAKKHDRTQINNVAESIKQFGMVQPLVLDKNNEIVIGHCRYEALKKLGEKEAPCVMADDLTEEQIKKLRNLDNKLNESEWDYDLLKFDIEDLDFSGFEVDWEIPDLDFEMEDDDDSSRYTDAINIPQYTPTGEKPSLTDLCDYNKSKELIDNIKSSNIDDDIKEFLIMAAYRHNVFNYSKIAEFYAHSNKDIQELMEQSALVIIDFEDAIKYGFTNLKQELLEIEEEDRNEQ